MANLLFIDTAFPASLNGSLHGAIGLCFYAGGDTPHVWTLAEVKRFRARYLLPVWVRSDPANAAQGVSEATAFASRLRTVYNAPKGILVALDTETAINSAYVTAFVNRMNALGYPVIDYGSEYYVHQNAEPDGYYWGANWTNSSHIYPGDSATQYISLTYYDLSDFKSTLPLWDTRKGVTMTTTIVALPVTVQEGDTGNHVRAIQVLAGPKRNHTLVIDGIFGPKTRDMVMGVQTVCRLKVDGIVGYETWNALLNT